MLMPMCNVQCTYEPSIQISDVCGITLDKRDHSLIFSGELFLDFWISFEYFLNNTNLTFLAFLHKIDKRALKIQQKIKLSPLGIGFTTPTLSCLRAIPQIHLWCDTWQPLVNWHLISQPDFSRFFKLLHHQYAFTDIRVSYDRQIWKICQIWQK